MPGGQRDLDPLRAPPVRFRIWPRAAGILGSRRPSGTAGSRRRKPLEARSARRAAASLLVLLVSLGAAGGAGAQESEQGFRAEPSRIHLPGEISCVLSADLDGDGTGEVVVGTLEDTGPGEPRKVPAVFRAAPGGRYGPGPARTFPVPEGTGVVAFEDVNNDGRDDLVYTCRGSLWARPAGPDLRLADDPLRILRCAHSLPYARDRIFAVDLFRDMNHDGRPDILLPTPEGYALFLQAAGGGFSREPDASFALDYRATLSEAVPGRILGTHSQIPLPTQIDLDRDGVLDLVFADGDTCTFFPFRREAGAYGEPRTVRLPVPREGLQFVASQVDDLDADGWPDVFVMRGVARKVSLNIDNLFFRGRPGPSYPAREDRALSHERQIIPPWVMDLDGDRRKEFVTFSQRLNLNSVVDYFLRDRVAVDVAVHTIQEGVYGQEPAAVRKVFLTVEEEEGRPGAAAGDFNGDGRDDFVYTPDSARVHYLLCGGSAWIPERASYSLEIPSYGTRVVEDFNRDGRDDLAILYEVGKRRGDLTLLISTPP